MRKNVFEKLSFFTDKKNDVPKSFKCEPPGGAGALKTM